MTNGSRWEESLAWARRIDIDPQRSLVVVAPHPDDEVIGIGGVLFDHAAAGGLVAIVSITDGDAYDPTAASAERRSAAARRRCEQNAALAVLGVAPGAVRRLGVPDGSVADHVGEVSEVLRDILASIPRDGALVVAPWRDDQHPDHEAATRAVQDACPYEVLEVPIWSWRTRTQIEPTWRELVVVPISDAAREAKRRALLQHRSQLSALSGGRAPILSPEFVADFDRTVEVAVR